MFFSVEMNTVVCWKCALFEIKSWYVFVHINGGPSAHLCISRSSMNMYKRTHLNYE